MSEDLLRGRVALVTGGSREIRAAIARALAKYGAKVMVSGRDQLALARVTDEIRAARGYAQLAMAELTGERAVRRLRSTIEIVWGQVELLVARADGGSALQPLVTEDTPGWRSTR